LTSGDKNFSDFPVNQPTKFTHFMHPGKSGQTFSTIWTVLSAVNQ